MFGKTRRNRSAALALVACSLVALTAACARTGDSPTDTGGTPQDGGTLRVAHNTHVTSLDPTKSVSGNDKVILYSIYDRLFTFNRQTMQPEPGLATEYEWVSPTDLQLTLREGVTFHDGEPFNAEAVKYSINRAITRPGSTVALDLHDIIDIKTTGDYTVDLILDKANSALPILLSDNPGMIVSPAAAEQYGDDYEKHPAGTGPFKVVDFNYDQFVKVERFDDYWQGKAHLDGIDFTIISDPTAAVNALQAGEADFISKVDVSNVPRLDAMQGVSVAKTPSLGILRCRVNSTLGVLEDVRVRQALFYAVDRDAINKVANAGLGSPTSMLVPPQSWAYPKEVDGWATYDPAKAKELLADAGFTDTITLDVAGDTNPVWRAIMDALKAQMEPAGINLELTPLDPSVAQTEFNAGKYHMWCNNYAGRPDPSQAFNQNVDPSSALVADYTASPELMDALERVTSESTQEGRLEAIADVSRIAIKEEARVLPLASIVALQAYSNNVHDYEPNLSGNPLLYNVWLTPADS